MVTGSRDREEGEPVGVGAHSGPAAGRRPGMFRPHRELSCGHGQSVSPTQGQCYSELIQFKDRVTAQDRFFREKLNIFSSSSSSLNVLVHLLLSLFSPLPSEQGPLLKHRRQVGGGRHDLPASTHQTLDVQSSVHPAVRFEVNITVPIL